MRNRVTGMRGGRREKEKIEKNAEKEKEWGGEREGAKGRLHRMGKARAAQKLLNLIRLCRIAGT